MVIPSNLCFFFAASEKQWPKIHPFESWLLFARETTPMLCVYSSQVKPSPVAPALATQLVVQCQPLKVRSGPKNFGTPTAKFSYAISYIFLLWLQLAVRS